MDARLRIRLRNGYLNTKYGYRMQPASRWGYLAMHLLPPPWRLEWDHYARHLKPPAAGRNKLLDVGCGNGEFLLREKNQGWEVYGLDSDSEALSHARKAGIEVRQGAVEPDHFPEHSFDAITCHQVIEHSHDVHSFATTLHRWLKPGGSLWIGTPNVSSKMHERFGNNWYPLHPPQHLVLFNINSLTRLLEATGFRCIRIRPRGYNETHYERVSNNIAASGKTLLVKYEDLVQRRGRMISVARSILMENQAWALPSLASDLTISATR